MPGREIGPMSQRTGGAIRAWRHHRQLTMTQLFTKTGLTFGQIERRERGLTAIDVDDLLALASALEVDAIALLMGETPESEADALRREVQDLQRQLDAARQPPGVPR